MTQTYYRIKDTDSGEYWANKVFSENSAKFFTSIEMAERTLRAPNLECYGKNRNLKIVKCMVIE